MNLENIEMKVETALFRIKDLYDRTEGKCVLSFSGGKDSTIVAHLYMEALNRGLVGDIPFIFADTQV
jgi:3'-phosphoadenosine 5'-phosphosulfate sulfotransferase (PAPS reductase)/FAD synthetase